MTKRQPSKLLKLVPALALSFGVVIPLPSSASAAPTCVDDFCTVTYTLSGQTEVLDLPPNARNLSFDVAGAQGGKSGGGGGRVTGTLTFVPDVLYVTVGGVGTSAENAPGGFNGGGAAGAGADVEGSGGGASDIRTSPDLSSRIVVAGGGGGRGAGLGSGGGAGGGLAGASGKTGQGAGGAGGTQLAGGLGGAGNGTGSSGTSGSLGQGGTGGTSSLFGGGGGGGGYFGGGGGGSDSDSCCTDAGGGGGGSSYTADSLVTNVVHSQGVWPGSGQIIIQYQLVPAVQSITVNQQEQNIDFAIEFSGQVQGFEETDIEVNHSSGVCSQRSLTGSGASYSFNLSGCQDGDIFIIVNALSVSNSKLSGPETAFQSSTVTVATFVPEPEPTDEPTEQPTEEPTEQPTEEPIQEPTPDAPIDSTPEPTSEPEPEQVLPESEPADPVVNGPQDNSGSEQSDSGPISAPVPAEQAAAPEELPPSPADLLQGEQSLLAEPADSKEVGDLAKAAEGKAPTEAESFGQDPIEPQVFEVPESSSLNQAAQTVVIPEQGIEASATSFGLWQGLLALGVFGLLAGLLVSRRLASGSVIS